MRSLYAVLLFGAALGVGRILTLHSWGGQVYVYMGERRAPASVRELKDYTPVRASALSEPVQAQVMDGAGVSASADAVGIKLGHPLITMDDGERGFACAVPGHPGLYDRVRITLYGTGVTDNGNEPHLDIDTACRSSAAQDTLDTIWIPMGEIERQPNQDGDQVLRDADQTRVTRANIPKTWPESWTLVSVRFYRTDEADPGLTLTAAELGGRGSDLLSFSWSPSGSSTH